MSEGAFQRVISEHLALAERNKRLERTMPLGPYREYYGGGVADDVPPHRGQEEPSTELSVVPRGREAGSWWDTSEERSLPAEFDWGEGD